MSDIVCPECGASVKLGPSVPRGRRVRCPECRAVLESDDGPRQPPREQPGKRSLLPLLLIGGLFGFVLLIGAGVGIYLLLRNPAVAPNTTVTLADLDKIEAYMSLDEVEAIQIGRAHV